MGPCLQTFLLVITVWGRGGAGNMPLASGGWRPGTLSTQQRPGQPPAAENHPAQHVHQAGVEKLGPAE